MSDDTGLTHDLCADCWHDLRQHREDGCAGPLCSCKGTPEDRAYFRLPVGNVVVGAVTRRSAELTYGQ